MNDAQTKDQPAMEEPNNDLFGEPLPEPILFTGPSEGLTFDFDVWLAYQHGLLRAFADSVRSLGQPESPRDTLVGFDVAFEEFKSEVEHVLRQRGDTTSGAQ
jgi:hypothetical protein